MATVIGYNMLNDDVLEIIIQETKIFPFKSGQRALIGFKDEQGEFKRAYSIADYEVHGEVSEMTLCIKLLPEGRGSKILKTLKVGSQIDVGGIFGHFVLKENDTPKVFIGTGTGLVPVFNMVKSCECLDKFLIYSTPYLKEMFYEEHIKNIPDLKYEIHITREEIEGYKFGRFNLDTYDFKPETEFYICGNPTMVTATIEKLKSLGFEKIYSEQF